MPKPFPVQRDGILGGRDRLLVDFENHITGPQARLRRGRIRLDARDHGTLQTGRQVELLAHLRSDVVDGHAVEDALVAARKFLGCAGGAIPPSPA